jgi:hypothetical protein
MEKATNSKQTLKDKKPPLGATLGGRTNISISIRIITTITVMLFCISVIKLFLSIFVVP